MEEEFEHLVITADFVEEGALFFFDLVEELFNALGVERFEDAEKESLDFDGAVGRLVCDVNLDAVAVDSAE